MLVTTLFSNCFKIDLRVILPSSELLVDSQHFYVFKNRTLVFHQPGEHMSKVG